MEEKWCLQETLGLSYIKMEGTFLKMRMKIQRIIMIIGYNNSSMRVWEGREGLVNKRNITSSMGMRIGEFRI